MLNYGDKVCPCCGTVLPKDTFCPGAIPISDAYVRATNNTEELFKKWAKNESEYNKEEEK